MNLQDIHDFGARGHIMGYQTSRTDGKSQLVSARPNVITYRAADLMAKMLGGETSYIPSHIGFIYAPVAKAFDNPASNRDQEWSAIELDIANQNGNMLLCPLTAAPVYGIDGVQARYDNNVVTLGSMSDIAAPLVFSGNDFEMAPPAISDFAFFQVVLVSRKYAPGSTIPQYIPFARAGLTAGTDGIIVQNNADLTVYWTISFK